MCRHVLQNLNASYSCSNRKKVCALLKANESMICTRVNEKLLEIEFSDSEWNDFIFSFTGTSSVFYFHLLIQSVPFLSLNFPIIEAQFIELLRWKFAISDYSTNSFPFNYFLNFRLRCCILFEGRRSKDARPSKEILFHEKRNQICLKSWQTFKK